MSDKTTKALLFAIALGLWANLAVQLLETPVQAQVNFDLSRIESYVRGIATGTCTNTNIC